MTLQTNSKIRGQVSLTAVARALARIDPKLPGETMVLGPDATIGRPINVLLKALARHIHIRRVSWRRLNYPRYEGRRL